MLFAECYLKDKYTHIGQIFTDFIIHNYSQIQYSGKGESIGAKEKAQKAKLI